MNQRPKLRNSSSSSSKLKRDNDDNNKTDGSGDKNSRQDYCKRYKKDNHYKSGGENKP